MVHRSLFPRTSGSPIKPLRLAAPILGMLTALFCVGLPAAGSAQSSDSETLVESWGPFARQCAMTRLLSFVPRARLSPREVTETYRQCFGFSALPMGDGFTAVTASAGEGSEVPSPTILRFLRGPRGLSRAAVAGDPNLLAQGSDNPQEAERLARDIGLSAEQLAHLDAIVTLPVRLWLPWPLDVTLQCRHHGGGREGGRNTIAFDCTAAQNVDNEHFSGTLKLTGVVEVDERTGVRVGSHLSGDLTGSFHASESRVRFDDNRVVYRLTTDFQ